MARSADRRYRTISRGILAVARGSRPGRSSLVAFNELVAAALAIFAKRFFASFSQLLEQPWNFLGVACFPQGLDQAVQRGLVVGVDLQSLAALRDRRSGLAGVEIKTRQDRAGFAKPGCN